MTPAVIYARFSTDRQDARSIEDQLRRCREYAERHDYEIVDEYSDAAVSGTHTNRPELQRMLAAVASRRCPFRAVLVYDLSRLSRDIGATHSIVFDKLAGADVELVDVSSGVGSKNASAEALYTVTSMGHRQFITMISQRTHLGMDNRARTGHSTGGSLFGYRTVEEQAPRDPEHPRKQWVIHEPEAAIVRRIFAAYDEGACGYKAIAEQLNEEGIPAPRDGRRGHKIGRGWNHSSVRAILSNPKYVGEWIWNTHKWTRSRTTGKATRRARPESEHVKREIPELAIIERAQWDRIQARLVRVQRKGSTGGRPAGSSDRPYLLSGLLRCGSCGGPMSIHGQRVKNGVTYRNFACTANRSRGASICANSASISERKITTAFVNALKETLSSPEVADAFVRGFERRISETRTAPVGTDLDKQLREAEARVRNVTAAIARMPESEALYAQLAAEESTVKRLRSEISKARPAAVPKVAPSRTAIRGAIGRYLDTIVTEAPERGREVLARSMTPLTLVRKDDSPGTWQVSGAVRLRAVLANLSSGGKINGPIFGGLRGISTIRASRMSIQIRSKTRSHDRRFLRSIISSLCQIEHVLGAAKHHAQRLRLLSIVAVVSALGFAGHDSGFRTLVWRCLLLLLLLSWLASGWRGWSLLRLASIRAATVLARVGVGHRSSPPFLTLSSSPGMAVGAGRSYAGEGAAGRGVVVDCGLGCD